MLNEHEREEGPEEGEYHFSDEGGYEPHLEEAKPPLLSEASGLAAKFSSYRRFVILGAIAAGVLLIAYLAIPPLTTSTSTEIAAAPPPVSTPKQPVLAPKSLPVVAPSVPSPQPKLVEQPKAIPLESPHPSKIVDNHLKPPLPENKVEPTPVVERGTSTEARPALQMNAPSSAAPGSPLVDPDLARDSLVSVQQAAQISAENKAVLDKLTALEQTSTRVISQLQTEYAQKIVDYETQNKVLQEQVRVLNTRLASMEAEMSKLQIQNKQTPQTLPTSAESVSVTENNSFTLQPQHTPTAIGNASFLPSNFKVNYTVQAIIPGRAWLRNEGGETVTVAEGDLLKNLGRVTKIDPYDGTIAIDTGQKVITLTYGNGDYT